MINVTDTSHSCYPWVAEELNKTGANFTLDDINDVVMKRNYAGITFIGITMLLGIIGNAHVLFVFSKRKYKGTFNHVQRSIHVNYRIFILWLSTLNLFQCTVVAPLLIVYLVYPVTYPSNELCKFFRFVLYFIPVAMSLTFIAVAVDRYLVICKTFKNKMTEKHSLLMCLATVIVAIILTWPAPILFGRGEAETGIKGMKGYRCYIEHADDKIIITIQQFYQALLVLFFFAVMLVLFILYARVRRDYKKLLTFRRTSRRYSSSTTEHYKQQQSSQENQRLWIYGSVTIGYVISALPYHILAILWFAKVIIDCDMNLSEAQVFYMFIWSYFFSPVINPIVYGFQDDGFRYSVEAIYRKVSLRRPLVKKYSVGGTVSEANSDSNIDQHDDLTGATTERLGALECGADIRPGNELNDALNNMASTTIGMNGLILNTGLKDNPNNL